jgi:hypothetical protein
MPSIVKRATPCNNLLQGRLTNSQIAHEFALVGVPSGEPKRARCTGIRRIMSVLDCVRSLKRKGWGRRLALGPG